MKLSVGARIILRRNLNSDLFNGSMGVLTGFLYEPGQVSQLLIKFDNGIQHNLPRSCTNFELMRVVYVQRHQFPITLSYAITIHKARGLSLKCAIVDIGKSTFGFGMHYVALSRITEISGLFLLSISYEKIQTDSRAIVVYNRLRKTYRNDLPQIKINNISKTTSTYFASGSFFTENDAEPRNPIHKSSSNMANAVKTVQRDNQQQHLKGFVNRDKTFCYANSVLQLLLNVDAFKGCIMDSNAQGPVTRALKQIVNDMTSVSHALLNAMPVRQAVGNEYAATIQQDASEFLLHILNKLTNEGTNIQNSIQGIQGYEERCSLQTCPLSCRTIQNILFLTFIVDMPNDTDNTSFQQLLTSWSSCIGYTYNTCGANMERRAVIRIAPKFLIIVFNLFAQQNIRRHVKV